ncbi:hypothetical protein CTM74_05475 [Fusobacterium pseudoperiodonticum]|uniref:Uncharacterized protein n=1 Tax=Fusobacterium pseudoperiodonticum TaxID=2663009 RepID=A0AAD0ANH7_9FUSO|nr:hypothetical protein CTM64_06895 [Fusobacterium pseudoperiodonticum]ATV62849.1 hypothetical protein CTM74_05475 [Fusobacterium pseudoperiodonticum]
MGLTACKEKERILESTKDIPINENIVFNDYSVETVEDLAAFLVTVTEVENNKPVTITKVKKTFDWKVEEQEKDSYIVSAKYRDSTFKIPVTLSNNRVYTDIGYASVERNDEVYPLGSILPDLITEVQNDPKYQDYLK